jgi:hypothetical protein
VDSGSVNGQIADTLSINQKATEDTLKAWTTNEVTAFKGREGICSFSVSVNNAKDAGFDVVYSLKAATPASITAPNTQLVFEMTDTVHISPPPCLPGTWTASLPSEGTYPWLLTSKPPVTYGPWVGKGTVEIGIGTHGEITYNANGSYEGTQTIPNAFSYASGPPVLTEPMGEALSITGPPYPELNPGWGALPAQAGPFNLVVAATAVLTISGGNYPSLDGPRSKPVVENIDGTYSCNPGAGSGTITATVPDFGDLTFVKSGGEPPKVTTEQESSWRLIVNSAGNASTTTTTPATTVPPRGPTTGTAGSTLVDPSGDKSTISALTPGVPRYPLAVPPNTSVEVAHITFCAGTDPVYDVGGGFSLIFANGKSQIPGRVDVVGELPIKVLSPRQCETGLLSWDLSNGERPTAIKYLYIGLLSDVTLTWKL